VALFDYSGFDDRGRKTRGTVEAGSKRAAQETLRSRGIFVAELSEQQSRSATPGRRQLRRPGRLPVADLATHTRLLATLLQAGVALDEALQSLADQVEKPAQARLFRQLREQVRQGSAFHQALAAQERSFPPLYQRLVEVGESSGSLDQVLLQLADFLEEQARLKSRTTAALAYPLLMALVGSGVLLFLVSVVVPKITRMLVDLGQSLPLATRLLIGGNALLARYGWLLLLIGGALGLLLRRYYRSPAGRLRCDRTLLRLPVIGPLQRAIATARFSRTLGTLLRSGVPLLGALEISNSLLTNQLLRQTVVATQAAVREGISLAAPLQQAGAFVPLLAQMTAVGERSGTLEEMLLKVADQQERQVEIRLATLLALLEPLMILLMGSVVGFIVLAVLLPIFQASQGLG